MKLLLRFVPVLLLLVVSCRTCPIESCHTRKAHLHGGVKYRGQPLWKMQNPAIGQKIDTYKSKAGRNSLDRSKPLR